jgi:hypothetical protein
MSLSTTTTPPPKRRSSNSYCNKNIAILKVSNKVTLFSFYSCNLAKINQPTDRPTDQPTSQATELFLTSQLLVSHEIPHHLWNLKDHCRAHKSPPLVAIQMHRSTTYHLISLIRILIIFSHLRLCLPSHVISSGFPNNLLYACLISPTCATCPANLITLDLTALIILGEA